MSVKTSPAVALASTILAVVAAGALLSCRRIATKEGSEAIARQFLARLGESNPGNLVTFEEVNGSRQLHYLAFSLHSGEGYGVSVDRIAGRVVQADGPRAGRRTSVNERTRTAAFNSKSEVETWARQIVDGLTSPVPLRLRSVSLVPDKPGKGESVIYGAAGASFETYLHGHRFVDRYSGIYLSVDVGDRSLIEFGDSTSVPEVRQGTARLTEEEAREAARRQFNQRETAFGRGYSTELGWATGAGESVAHLAWRIGKGTEVSDDANPVFIDAETGQYMKNQNGDAHK